MQAILIKQKLNITIAQLSSLGFLNLIELKKDSVNTVDATAVVDLFEDRLIDRLSEISQSGLIFRSKIATLKSK